MILYSCQKVEFKKESGALEAFAEMVKAGVKPIALSQPLSPSEMDLFMPEATRIAEKYEISVFREPNLIGTSLFDSSVVQGKEVLILYKGESLEAYQMLKKRVNELEASKEYSGQKKEDVSRSFGRMLGYPESNINNLLAQNSDFRDLGDFGITAQELIWFYKDLPAAKKFYSETLGLNMLSEEEKSVTFQIAGDSRLVIKSVEGSGYSGNEVKSVALALLTDNLEPWYSHLQKEKVTIKYTLKVKPDGAHDGFVAVDPEGYLLEFEMFRMHPENEKFIPELKSCNPLATSLGAEFNFYASITWLYYKDMLPMENFMTQNLGLELSADQGWAKIYRLSDNSYLGLVDEKRGMNSFSEEKLVEVKIGLSDSDGWETYLKKKDSDSTRRSNTFSDLGGYLFRF
ncbi:VOC family protein [Algoriphagus lutimaris]|uniref:VOC family protein n=1 Tax=Algoriphagus lutimaris TaxID=613197 RepID=UPI00196ABF79|nr:VOC family protein [Algoriphagus lutimaris]MBN3520685.1 VOC family protein [Algoriphagus lutimaris]